MKAILAVLLALAPAAASAQVKPADISDEAKVLALKLGYAMNGNSMVRWGSIDLTNLDKPVRTIPPAPLKPGAPR